jgi:hypothetical protein
MKHLLYTVMAAVLLLPAGCSRRANEGVAEGPNGEKLMVNPVDKLKLSQGETKKFSVGVQRVKIDGPVRLSFSGLPAGAHIVEQDTVVPEGKNDLILTMKVDDNAPPTKEVAIKVTAATGQLQTTRDLRLEIVPALDKEEKDKEAFKEEMDNRLNAVKKKLDEATDLLKKLNDNQRAQFQKDLSHLTSALGTARDKFNSMATSSLETWRSKQHDVTNAVTNVENAEKKLRASLDKALPGGS